MSAEHISELERQTHMPVSLETPIDDERVLGDLVLADANDDDLDEAVDQADLDAEVARLLERLSARERAVVRLRYGLVDDRAHSLEECAQALGHEADSGAPVSRERIRQIEKKAFKKLRKVVAV